MSVYCIKTLQNVNTGVNVRLIYYISCESYIIAFSNDKATGIPQHLFEM